MQLKAIGHAIATMYLLASIGPGSAPALAHHAVAHDLLVSEAPWIVVNPLKPTTAHAYLSLRNRSRHDHKLVRATSPVAGTTTLHESIDSPTAPQRTMTPIALPACSNTAFTPTGGPHVTLHGLHTRVETGTRLPLDLYFQDDSILRLEAKARVPKGFREI